MLLAELVETSERVAASPSRRAKTELLAGCLRRLEPDDAAAGAAFLSGELLQRQLGVGWAALRELPEPAPAASLTVGDVAEACERIGEVSGPGSVEARRTLLAGLFSCATAGEQRFLGRLLLGELRQGALEGVLVDALAVAAGVAVATIRRGVMLRGDLPAVAALALTGGEAELATIGLEVGRGVRPMLASPAESADDVLARHGGRSALEWKLDGARIQIHRQGSQVRVLTRTLDDVTERVPEIVAATRALPVATAVLDAEAIALHDDGRPLPFQVTNSRFASRSARGRERTLTPFVFDVLHLDGSDVLDLPYEERYARLAAVVPDGLRAPRTIASTAAALGVFLEDAIAAGHEGLLAKALDAPYEAGRRGSAWLKLKPTHTLDLVVLAAEWGHGRRRGWLSNLHLGTPDPATGELVMLGKTFKGLTDELLAWQTAELLARAVEQDDWTVRVRPELVVEIAFDGVQTSSRYPGGVALRFARVRRYRPDKTVAEADTLEAVRAIHARA